MRCESCGQRAATVHQTVVVNGQKSESHLCEVCASQQGQGVVPAPGFSMPNLSIHQLLASILGQDPFGGTQQRRRSQEEPRCKSCGLSYSEFADSGRLGCAQCYDYLDPHLAPLIKRIHGTPQHTGKAPKRTGGLVRKRRELSQFKQQLSQAIAMENFEEAARLRDQIKTIEAELQAGGGGVVVE